jgi:hypothetical protein
MTNAFLRHKKKSQKIYWVAEVPACASVAAQQIKTPSEKKAISILFFRIFCSDFI